MSAMNSFRVGDAIKPKPREVTLKDIEQAEAHHGLAYTLLTGWKIYEESGEQGRKTNIHIALRHAGMAHVLTPHEEGYKNLFEEIDTIIKGLKEPPNDTNT